MLTDGLDRLLAVNGFLPHGYCISWSPTLVATFVVSDALIFLSYFSMPVALAYFAYHRRDFPYRWVLILFAAFILACGTTHLMGAVVLWTPVYWLDAALKAVTALLSVATAIILWPLIPHVLRLPSPAQLQLANARLQAEIAEHRRTEEALRVANKELDDFAYAVSHDLRAPLRALAGFSQALEQDYGDRLDATAKSYIGHIGAAGTHMAALVEGLLVLSRSSRGEIKRAPVDLTAMAERLRTELQHADAQRQVAWEIEAGLMASGDERMLESVMRNLLDNAWKYTSATVHATIRVSSATRDAVHLFCVADNGAGFDMAHAGQLFMPFRRLHRQDEFPGIGIGLATVQRIIVRHGGYIEAEARPGQGATFSFSLGE